MDCEDRFNKIDESLETIKGKTNTVARVVGKNSKRIAEVEKKVFNGFGESIVDMKDRVTELSKDIKNTRNLIFTLLIMIVVGFTTNFVVQSYKQSQTRSTVIQAVREINETSVEGPSKGTTP